jgi:EAL domain-containing protein (putative c-di-GMP-specific phosphodiesterase class I)
MCDIAHSDCQDASKISLMNRRARVPIQPGGAVYLEKLLAGAPVPPPCKSCVDSEKIEFDFRMAFQPIVDARDHSIFGYEALVRTAKGGGAADLIAQVRPD